MKDSSTLSLQTANVEEESKHQTTDRESQEFIELNPELFPNGNPVVSDNELENMQLQRQPYDITTKMAKELPTSVKETLMLSLSSYALVESVFDYDADYKEDILLN